MTPILYLLILPFGLVIGSFLNVLIYRIPKHEEFVKTRSHCMTCGYQLKWYDLVPVFSYLALGGRCRKCETRLSVQYPLIEGLNGAAYCLIFAVCGLGVDSLLYCLLFSALLALSVIDYRTYEIPLGFNVFILALGVARVATDWENWSEYVIGFLAVSVFLYVVYLVTGGRGIGGGDVKLMAVCGLVIGWKCIILAFLLGCILGSVCHIVRMRVGGAGHVLAMGPYLSAGVMIAALWGERLLEWYLSFLGL